MPPPPRLIKFEAALLLNTPKRGKRFFCSDADAAGLLQPVHVPQPDFARDSSCCHRDANVWWVAREGLCRWLFVYQGSSSRCIWSQRRSSFGGEAHCCALPAAFVACFEAFKMAFFPRLRSQMLKNSFPGSKTPFLQLAVPPAPPRGGPALLSFVR